MTCPLCNHKLQFGQAVSFDPKQDAPQCPSCHLWSPRLRFLEGQGGQAVDPLTKERLDNLLNFLGSSLQNASPTLSSLLHAATHIYSGTCRFGWERQLSAEEQQQVRELMEVLYTIHQEPHRTQILSAIAMEFIVYHKRASAMGNFLGELERGLAERDTKGQVGS